MFYEVRVEYLKDDTMTLVSEKERFFKTNENNHLS